MKQPTKIRTISFQPIRTFVVVGVLLTVTTIMAATIKASHGAKEKKTKTAYKASRAPINRDSVESVKAFDNVYKVLMSPRCMNCHPSGDVPLQGDDNHLHTMGPKRGAEGKGLYAMKCANCHQPTNTPGIHTPPGNPDWHLPPATMRMVFQGRTPHQLAKQLIDPKQNGNKTKKQLLEHAKDGLVVAGWNPGEGRTLPPLSHAEFTAAWVSWINKGAYAPKE